MSAVLATYEVVAIIRGSLKPSDAKKELEKLEKEVTALGGTIAHKATWETRPLAYKIAGETTGTYFIADFTADAAKVPEFDNHLRLDPGVIRHLLIRQPKEYVWKDYTSEDLEADYTKVGKVFDDTAIAAKKGAKAPVGKAAPIKRKVEKATPSKAEVDQKLDNILGELGK